MGFHPGTAAGYGAAPSGLITFDLVEGGCPLAELLVDTAMRKGRALSTSQRGRFRGCSRAPWQNPVMRNLLRPPAIAILVVLPIAAVSLSAAGIGSAEPLNCINGQFWDPITKTCQTPQQAEDCGPSAYWNALSNVCRPLGQL